MNSVKPGGAWMDSVPSRGSTWKGVSSLSLGIARLPREISRSADLPTGTLSRLCTTTLA